MYFYWMPGLRDYAFQMGATQATDIRIRIRIRKVLLSDIVHRKQFVIYTIYTDFIVIILNSY